MENKNLMDRIRGLPPIGSMFRPPAPEEPQKVTGWLLTENAEYVLYGGGHMVHRSRIGLEGTCGTQITGCFKGKGTMKRIMKTISGFIALILYFPVMGFCYTVAVAIWIKQKIRENGRRKNEKQSNN